MERGIYYRFRLCRDGSKVKEFSISLEQDIAGKTKTIIRYDNSENHDNKPHKHIYKKKGKSSLEILGEIENDYSKLVNEIEKNLIKNLDKIIDNYKYSK